MGKIIVGLPYHAQKSYCLPQLMKWVDEASLPDTEVIMRWHRGTWGEKGAVKHQREFFRQLTLNTDATHLFSVGVDTIPPLDALERLLSHNLPIVSGLYYGRHKGSGSVAGYKGEGLVEAEWVGMDCILIAREVLEKVSWFDYEITDDDYPWCAEVQKKGYKVMLDTSVRCKHYADAETYF